MDELLNTLLNILKNDIILTTPDSAVVIGQLQTGNSIALQASPSATEYTFLGGRGQVIDVPIQFLAKNTNPQTCINDLELIGAHLVGLRPYPTLTSMQWILAERLGTVQYVDKDENQYYIYTLIMNHKILYGG